MLFLIFFLKIAAVNDDYNNLALLIKDQVMLQGLTRLKAKMLSLTLQFGVMLRRNIPFTGENKLKIPVP